jgi:hypothetical protein
VTGADGRHEGAGRSGTDSAGRPWAGRSLPAGGDDQDGGRPDEALARTLAALAEGRADDTAVVAALGTARVLVPVVAVPGAAGSGAAVPGAAGSGARTGHRAAGRTEMASVTLTAPDGRRALPVFTGLSSLRLWDPAARPVPVDGRRAAVSAVADGCAVLVVDPAGPVTFVVSRPAVWALGQGRRWVPPHLDPLVVEELRAIAGRDPAIRSLTTEAGPGGDLRVVAGLGPGLDGAGLRERALAISAGLRASAVLRERAQEVTLRIVPA